MNYSSLHDQGFKFIIIYSLSLCWIRNLFGIIIGKSMFLINTTTKALLPGSRRIIYSLSLCWIRFVRYHNRGFNKYRMHGRKSLLKRGGTPGLKLKVAGGGGGTPTHFFFIWVNFPDTGRVSSYITKLSDKQASKKKGVHLILCPHLPNRGGRDPAPTTPDFRPWSNMPNDALFNVSHYSIPKVCLFQAPSLVPYCKWFIMLTHHHKGAYSCPDMHIKVYCYWCVWV